MTTPPGYRSLTDEEIIDIADLLVDETDDFTTQEEIVRISEIVVFLAAAYKCKQGDYRASTVKYVPYIIERLREFGVFLPTQETPRGRIQ